MMMNRVVQDHRHAIEPASRRWRGGRAATAVDSCTDRRPQGTYARVRRQERLGHPGAPVRAVSRRHEVREGVRRGRAFIKFVVGAELPYRSTSRLRWAAAVRPVAARPVPLEAETTRSVGSRTETIMCDALSTSSRFTGRACTSVTLTARRRYATAEPPQVLPTWTKSTELVVAAASSRRAAPGISWGSPSSGRVELVLHKHCSPRVLPDSCKRSNCGLEMM